MVQPLPQWIGILIIVIVGALAGLYYVKVIKKPVFGHLWGAIIVGVIGSVLGGYFLDFIIKFMVNNTLFSVDFVATFFGAFLLIWIFSKLAHQ
jgi:uncharacterized membrane protein YeaQ/YmgE (transglycosylase-associated protein family)